jgi:uncharacterized protein YecT (DUF1311 family)
MLMRLPASGAGLAASLPRGGWRFYLAHVRKLRFKLVEGFWSTLPIAAADTGMTQEYSTCLEKSNGVTIEMINCILAETIRQDARLNENYKRLISKLTTERKNALIEAQRNWIKFRDTNCGFYADPKGGSAIGLSRVHSKRNNSTCQRTTTPVQR